MTSILIASTIPTPNPLDLAEALITDRDWAFDRPAAEELVAEINGQWCNYRVWFTWQEMVSTLIFTCAFETKIPANQRDRIYPLLAQINSRVWLGHFDMCPDEGTISFRHGMLLRGSGGATPEQLEDLLDIAVAECERFYPAFQAVLWGGRSPKEAMEVAVFDTVGEA